MYISVLFFRMTILFFRLPEYEICLLGAAHLNSSMLKFFLLGLSLFFPSVYPDVLLMCVCVWLRDRDCDECAREKKKRGEKTSFFSSSLSFAVFFQSCLIDAIFDDDVLSLFSPSSSSSLLLLLLSVGFYLLAKRTLAELWFDDEDDDAEEQGERASETR